MPLPEVIEILADLQGSALASQVLALEKFFALPPASISDASRRVLFRASVRAMETASDPYLLAERLLRFRGEAVPLLLDLLTRTPSSEVRILASLILVNNGSKVGVPALVEEIERGGDYLIMASYALANAGFCDHAPVLIDRPRRWSRPPCRDIPTTDDDLLLSLLDVLHKLRVPLPEDIRQKFSDPRASRFFRLAAERHDVGGST